MKVKVKKERGMVEEVGIELLKGAGAAAVGAGHGAVRELVSERAATLYRAGLAVGGLALKFTAKKKSLLSEAGSAFFYGAAFLEGNERGSQAARAWKEHREQQEATLREAELAKKTAALRADLEGRIPGLDGTIADARQAVEVERRAPALPAPTLPASD